MEDSYYYAFINCCLNDDTHTCLLPLTNCFCHLVFRSNLNYSKNCYFRLATNFSLNHFSNLNIYLFRFNNTDILYYYIMACRYFDNAILNSFLPLNGYDVHLTDKDNLYFFIVRRYMWYYYFFLNDLICIYIIIFFFYEIITYFDFHFFQDYHLYQYFLPFLVSFS